TQQLNVLNNCRSILPRTAPSSSKLPLCCSYSMDDQLMLDQSDTELLQSFQHLGPLLMQASQYMREKDEEPLNKKLKQEPVGADKAAQPHNPQNKALLTLIHHLAKVVLQHDRAIQMDRRQDSFVIFAQVSAEGALPLLTSKAKEWKDMTEKTTTLRTFLLKHLILELQQRAIKLSQSTQGTQLWDVAVTKGVILQDGSWPFQQWCHTEKKLTKSHRAPLPMSRILKDLQFMVELLTDNDHVMRFHSLRPQANVVPWMLQINLREDDLWRLFHQLSQSTLWGLLGLSLKQHNQQVSKPAQLLDQLTNMQGTPNKGLSRDTFTLTDWGRQHDLFRDLLLELRPQPFNLDAQLWFQGITQNWDENRGQADSAEFTSMLLQWVAPSFLSCHWQRRLMENECVRVHDQGDRYQPPTLQLDPSHSTDGIARLTDMLRRWHNDLGMYAGLLQAPEVLCVHVDRFIYEGHGRVRKTDTPVFFGGPIDVPVFTDDGLDCTWERYQMTAAFAHQGDAATGHYQALLRTQPSIRHPDADTYWLHCDDDRPALEAPATAVTTLAYASPAHKPSSALECTVGVLTNEKLAGAPDLAIAHALARFYRQTGLVTMPVLTACAGSVIRKGAGEAINWLPILTQTANSGQPPTTGSGSTMQIPNKRCTKIQKRSFQRACKRALQHGMAWFRGQAYTVDQFPQTLINKCDAAPPAPQKTNNWCSYKDQKHRLRVMQWNPGGLSQSSFLELKYWLRQQPIDIVVLSETKWSFNSCWSDDKWSYVHSASNDPRSGGVLIMIARRLATPDSIGFLALEDGRILHARIHHAKRATDILAVYQHVDYKTTQSRKLRAHLWAKLSDYVGQLPQRNQFICSGDFNTALPGVAPWTGTGHFHWQGSRTCGSQHEALTTAVDQAVEEPVDPSTDPEQIITHFFGHGITGADIALHSEPTRKKPDRLGPGKIADQYTAHSLTVAYVRTTWQGPSSLPHFSDEAPGVPFSISDLCVALHNLHPHKAAAMPFLPATVWKGSSLQIRTLVGNHRRSVQQQMRSPPRSTILGGVQLLLDLTRCKIAPLLWLAYMNKLLWLLTPLTGEAWIRHCLTLYADDLHVGCQFLTVGELDHHLQCMGHLLDCIERLKLQISLQKSYLIFSHTGSNVRHALKGRMCYLQNQAHLLLPRRTGEATALPLKTMGRYLGVIVSYHAFEQQTWLHRKKTAWIAYARLKRWLRHRQIRQSHRMYLWHTCVHTILVYGIFGTGVTVQSLTDYQLTVFQMIRILIGDHSYMTGHTHQRAIQNQSLPLPLQLLRHGAEKLWLRLQRRALQLDPTDFLQQVDWQHHQDTMHLIDQVHHSMPDVPIDGDALMTTPQAPAASSQAAPADPVTSGNRAERNSFLITTQPFWPTLKQIIRDQTWHQLQENPAIGQYLTHTCMICGIWNNRCQELHGHYRLHHSDVVTGIFAKSAQLTKVLRSPSPCVLCQREFMHGHTCTVFTQIAALLLHCQTSDVDVDRVLRCELCQTRCDDLQSLHRHLKAEHEVTVFDWNVARDSVPGSTACSHCGKPFTSRDGLRTHIITGKCEFFDPTATNHPLNAAEKWRTQLTLGFLDKQHLSAHQRLQLTLHCQLCGEIYVRSNDLNAHLQQAHGQLWQRSNDLVRYLLQTLISSRGCMCNPTVNDDSRTHICPGVRQMAMIFYTSETEMFIPQQYNEQTLRLTHRALENHARFQMLLNVVLDRDFSHLWHAPALLQMFRHWCTLCGAWFHTAALMTHQLTHHHDACVWAAQLKFQLVQCMQTEQPQDYQCKFCKLFFNDSTVDPDATTERAEQLQIHFASNCPVLQQIALVLQPLHGRSADARPVGHGAPAVFPTSGTPPDAGEPVHAGKRRRATEQEAQAGTRRRRQGRSATQPPEQGPAHTDPSPGQGGPATRSGHPDGSQTGLLRYLCPSQCGRSPPTADVEGQRVEGHDGEDHHPPHLPAEAPDPGATTEGHQVVSEHTGDPTVGRGSHQRSDSPGRVVAVPTVVPHREEAHQVSSGTAAHEPHPEGPPVHGGAPDRQRSCDALPFTETSSQCGSLDAPDQPARGRPVATVPPAESVHPVGTPGPESQAAQPTGQQTSAVTGSADQHAGDTEQRTRQREVEDQDQIVQQLRASLRREVARMTLGNTGHMCYANSAFTCFLWSGLSRDTFTLTDWGRQHDLFRDLLLELRPQPFNLDAQPGFRALPRIGMKIEAKQIQQSSQACCCNGLHHPSLAATGNAG
ncbi:unnamed protein product, partial [Cladocopium goreaui]